MVSNKNDSFELEETRDAKAIKNKNTVTKSSFFSNMSLQ